MNSKIIPGAILGAIFTVVVAIICFVSAAYLTGNLDKLLSPLFLIAATYIIFYALIAGGLEGAIVIILKLNLVTGAAFGLLFNLFLGFILLLLTGGGWDNGMTYAYYISIIVGIINGAVVSLINLWQQPLK